MLDETLGLVVCRVVDDLREAVLETDLFGKGVLTGFGVETFDEVFEEVRLLKLGLRLEDGLLEGVEDGNCRLYIK